MPTTNICFSLEEYGNRYLQLVKYARELGLRVLPRSCLDYPNNTILLADLPLRKTGRVVSAVARGGVILPVRYLLECHEAGRVLPVDSFQWQNQELGSTCTQSLLEASKYWRKSKCAPLQDLLVYIVGGRREEVNNHQAIIQAGGGQVVESQPESLEQRKRFLVLFLEEQGPEYSKWRDMCIEYCFACCFSRLLFELIIMRRLRDSRQYIPFSECISNTLNILGRNLKEENIMKRRKRSVTLVSSDSSCARDLQPEHRWDNHQKFDCNDTADESIDSNFTCSNHDSLSESAAISSLRDLKTECNHSEQVSSKYYSEYMKDEAQSRHEESLDTAHSIPSSCSNSESNLSSTDDSNTVDSVFSVIDSLKVSIQDTPKHLFVYNILRIALRNMVRRYQSSSSRRSSFRNVTRPFIHLFELESADVISEDAKWNVPLAVGNSATEAQNALSSHRKTERHFSDVRHHRLQKIAKQWTKEKVQSWSAAQITAWLNRHVNANAYYYRHTDPGDGVTQSLGKWDEEEQQLFFAEVNRVG